MGDMVYLHLQPYRQSSPNTKEAEKLKPRFYGPYRIVRRVGEVVHELELPKGCEIHNVFHILCLKKTLGKHVHVVTCTEFPPLDEEEELILVPEEILETMDQRLRNITIKEYLVKWKDLLVTDATRKGEQVLKHLELKLLKGKQTWIGRTVMSPSA